MSSLRAVFLFASDFHKSCLFSRKFPTVENRIKKQSPSDYVAIQNNEKQIIKSFFQQVIKKDLVEEQLSHQTYVEDFEIDHNKFDELLKEVDLNFNQDNIEYDSDCPIISLKINDQKTLWPCIYASKYKLYAVAFPMINAELYKKILKEKNNDAYHARKTYESQDATFLLSMTLLENLLNFVCKFKYFEENKIHALISNMIPFGTIKETNFDFMSEHLNYQNFLHSNKHIVFSSRNVAKQKEQHTKSPGWLNVLDNNIQSKLSIEIQEELKFVKYSKKENEKGYNVLLCDIICESEFTTNCEITIPVKEEQKEGALRLLGNFRVHPCAKIEDLIGTNNVGKITYFPPIGKIHLAVTETENVSEKFLPLKAWFQLKEASQNEVKIYLKIQLAEDVIGKFKYFYVMIPLKHLGTIADTRLMVQVGEVTVKNEKTSLFWNLKNKPFERVIVLSGTLHFDKEVLAKEDVKEELQINYNISKMIKNEKEEPTSDIRDNNCFCKIYYCLEDYLMSGVDVDKNSISFYPKISPGIQIKKICKSNEYTVWNELSFSSYGVSSPTTEKIELLKININETETKEEKFNNI